MERILLTVFCLSAWSISTCLLHQYHYVNELKTWTEAQSYCRRHYTDLATIRNSAEVDQLINSVSDNSVSEVWIGVFDEVEWRWSDGYAWSDSGYTNWDGSQPMFNSDDYFCVYTSDVWATYDCKTLHAFICSSGTQFVFINQTMNWTDAQSYCRSNYVDLATVKNSSDHQRILNVLRNNDHYMWIYQHMISSITSYYFTAWIGLFRNPTFKWSDGSSFSFKYWHNSDHPLGSLKIICGVASLENSGKWKLIPCDNRKPFVCYDTPPVVKKQKTVKLRMKVKDSSVDLNDPVIRANILKQLQDKLSMTGVNLKWKEQPDGKVFHKEKEQQKKYKKKKEL